MSLTRFVLLILCLSLATACTTRHRTAPTLVDSNGALEKTHYQAELVAPDGVKFRFTVFQPSLRRGQKAPLVIHSHGFALTRMESSLDMYQVILAGKTVMELWDKGYWVISIDQRGHGKTGGKIGLMDEDKEIADIVRLVDWAQENLALAGVDGDPKVGMIGESYGGGVQMLATVADPRIDAVVPITTWFDLERALIPDGVPKSDWLMFLGVAGYGINPWHMDSDIASGVFKEILFDKPQPALRARLRRNSLVSRCDAGEYPKADALLIQGYRDVLFPLNQALAARECFLKGGRDVRLIAVEHGHLAPTAQLSPRIPIWHVDPTVRCGGRNLDVQRTIINWFDLKLRDRNIPDSSVPHWCLTGDRALDAAQALPPAISVPFGPVAVGSGASGLVEWAARPVDHVGNWFRPARVPENWDEPRNGWLRPARVPLVKIEGPTWVAGVPSVDIDITDSDRSQPILFLRLAAWKPGSGSYRVLNQQVTPVRGTGPQRIELAAVRARLDKGEIVGLLVQGYSNQFRMAGSGWGTDATVQGTLALPVAGVSSP